MRVSALQEFLRNLGGSLSAVGVQQKSLEDIRAVARALEPFKDLDLEQLADFLARAAEFRRRGDVPAVSVAGLTDATDAARGLSESVQSLGTTDGTTAEEGIKRGKQAFQTALGKLAGEFGLGVKFTEDKKWMAELRSKGEVTRAVETLGRLVPQITDVASYQSEAVQSAIDDLGSMGAKVLKAAATELGATGTGTGKKYVESLLAKLSGVDGKPAKGGKKKADGPTASDEQVETMAKSLEGMVERARDPNAVPDSEVDAILARVGSEFSPAQQKAIAKRVTGKAGNNPAEVATRLRADLTAVKRLLESQKV